MKISSRKKSIPKKKKSRRSTVNKGYAAELEDNIVRLGNDELFVKDLYAWLLKASWWHLGCFLLLGFLVGNAFFAILFLLVDGCIHNARPGSFFDAFFFSVQTMTTIGYGRMTPVGTYGNTLVALESLVGLVGVAMATGLAFSKFSRPTAKVLFSRNMLIYKRNGVPCLNLRVANARGTHLTEASIRVTVLLDEETEEGEQMRRLHDLKLQRTYSPVFLMSWLVTHEITEDSPLYGMTDEELRGHSPFFFVSLTGVDKLFAQSVNTYYAYRYDEVLWNKRFGDVITTLDDGRYLIDLSHFHDVEPLDKDKHLESL